MKPRPARGEISETPRDASEGAEGRPSFFDGLQDGSLVQVRIKNRLFMSWLIPKTGTGLSDKVSVVEHDSFSQRLSPSAAFSQEVRPRAEGYRHVLRDADDQELRAPLPKATATIYKFNLYWQPPFEPAAARQLAARLQPRS